MKICIIFSLFKNGVRWSFYEKVFISLPKWKKPYTRKHLLKFEFNIYIDSKQWNYNSFDSLYHCICWNDNNKYSYVTYPQNETFFEKKKEKKCFGGSSACRSLTSSLHFCLFFSWNLLFDETQVAELLDNLVFVVNCW